MSKLVIYRSGDFALGDFNEANKRLGQVKYQSTKGPQFTGEFDNNKRSGEGKLYLDQQKEQRFEGVYEEDKKRGYGKFVSPEGTFEGYFKDGVLSGYGRSITNESLLYEGFFSDNKKDGYGIEVQPNSDCYFGEFKGNRKEGLGLYLFAKGGYYYGFFKNNEKSGLGVLYTKYNHSYYFGHFENDKKSGRGTEVCKDYSVYHGFYEQNRRSGPGVMEYSNKSTYIGEWKTGMRSGKGRFESGALVTSGHWEYDKIKFASAVDLDEIMKPFYQQTLPANMKAHLKAIDYKYPTQIFPNPVLSTYLKPVLLDLLKQKAAQGFIRGSIFKKICTLLYNSRVIKEVTQGIYNAFRNIPNHETAFSPIGSSIDIKFQSGQHKIRWLGVNYDNKKKPTFTFDHMIVSNDILFGFGTEDNQSYNLDGMCMADGGVVINQYFQTSSERNRYTCIAGPNYLAGVDQDENKVFLIPEQDMWKGFFTSDVEVRDKLAISLYMKIYNSELIYGFGRDKISIYMVSGKIVKAPPTDPDQRRIATFAMRYEKGYMVEFTGRFEVDEIRGDWFSNPVRGKFMIKKNSKYNAENVYHIVKGYRDTGVNERILMQSTLLSNLLVPNKAQLAILKFASTLNVQSSTEKEDSKDLGKKKKVRYAEDIALEYLENEAEAKRQAMLEEFKTTDDKGSLRRSKSELYQGESCVFDLFREAQSTQFYQEILADHEKVQIGGSPLFSNLDESEGKSQFFDITGSQLGKKAVKVNILGPVGSETYKKRQEDDEASKGKSPKASKGTSMNNSRDNSHLSPAKDNKRLVPIKTEDRSINLNSLKQSPLKKPKSRSTSLSRSDRSKGSHKKRPSPVRPKIEILETKSAMASKTRTEASKDTVTKANEEQIAKLKHDLHVPKIKFRELKNGVVPEESDHYYDLDVSEVAKNTHDDHDFDDELIQVKDPKTDDFDYSREDDDSNSRFDSRPSIEYKEVAKALNESDYLREIINGKDEDLEAIEDVKKRQEIKEYRNAKRAQAEEELKLDEHRSIVRRVCALRSLKEDPTAPEKETQVTKTDLNRIKRANFKNAEDRLMLETVERYEQAVVKQYEVDNKNEMMWSGKVSSLGKEQPFFIENLIFLYNGFKGCMTYDDTYYSLTGRFLEDGNRDCLPFVIEARTNGVLHYLLRGHFAKYALQLTMDPVEYSINIPRVLSLNFKSVPCTIFSEPYKAIYAGRARISELLLVVFYINDSINILSGKRNINGAYVVEHIRGGETFSQGVVILKQVRNPKRCTHPSTITLLDDRSQIGYVIEPQKQD